METEAFDNILFVEIDGNYYSKNVSIIKCKNCGVVRIFYRNKSNYCYNCITLEHEKNKSLGGNKKQQQSS